LGLDRELSARYSFLLSVPAILGGLLLSLGQGLNGSVPAPLMALGFLVSALAGHQALKILTKLVIRGRLSLFAPWCLLTGLAALIWSVVT
jgi:undecaprenyl-diphosphatase